MRDFQLLSGSSLLLVALASVGCNLVLGISDFKDEGQGGDTATGASNAGGNPTNGGDGPDGGNGTGASGGMGSCSEDPCKLIAPQCGCDAGEACTLDASQENRVCGPAGTAMANAPCGGDTQCTAGNFLNNGFCNPFCANDDVCTPLGSICAIPFPSGDTICSDPCDPLSNFGEGCTSGSGCYIVSTVEDPGGFFICSPNGGSLDGDPCNNFYDCLPGSGCYNDGTGEKCLQHCRVDTGAPCPGMCASIQLTVNGIEYGGCVP